MVLIPNRIDWISRASKKIYKSTYLFVDSVGGGNEIGKKVRWLRGHSVHFGVNLGQPILHILGAKEGIKMHMITGMLSIFRESLTSFDSKFVRNSVVCYVCILSKFLPNPLFHSVNRNVKNFPINLHVWYPKHDCSIKFEYF